MSHADCYSLGVNQSASLRDGIMVVETEERHSRLDWRAMAGMRDRLIHGYFGVDYDIV